MNNFIDLWLVVIAVKLVETFGNSGEGSVGVRSCVNCGLAVRASELEGNPIYIVETLIKWTSWTLDRK